MTAAAETARAMPDLLLGTGLALSALGPVLLRLGWQARRLPVALGWAALGLAAALTSVRAGAWGLATGCVIASACALALLALAAARTPAPAASSRRAARAVPERRAPPIAPKDLARRSATFATVALLDPLAALGFAFAIETLALAAGMAEANALALALFAMPLAWLALATWQMIRSDWRSRLLPALALALSGILTLVTFFHA